MNEKDFDIGEFLKTLRTDHKYSLRKLEENMSFSRSYISNVENGLKKDVSENFIQEYVRSLVNGDTEAFEIFKYINEASNNMINIELPSTINDPLTDPVINKFMNTHLFRSAQTKINNGKKELDISTYSFHEDINDLNFHLNDHYNSKYYKLIQLNDKDLKNIKDLIEKYLEIKLNNQIDLIERFKKSNTQYDDYSAEINKLQDDIESLFE